MRPLGVRAISAPKCKVRIFFKKTKRSRSKDVNNSYKRIYLDLPVVNLWIYKIFLPIEVFISFTLLQAELDTDLGLGETITVT